MLLLTVLLGLAAGILVNYLADVLPYTRRLAHPACLQCEAPFPWLAYWLPPRRCPACGARRSLRTWAVELIFMAATAWLYSARPVYMNFWVGLALLIYFGVVVVIDLEHHLILHPVSLVGAGLGLLAGILIRGPLVTLLGGAAGLGLVLLFYLGGVLVMRIVNARRGEPADAEALGFGDVILSGVLGLMLGWPLIGFGLVLAVLLGGAGSLVYLVGMLLARRYRSFAAIPYGPFLVGAAVLMLFFPDFLNRVLFKF